MRVLVHVCCSLCCYCAATGMEASTHGLTRVAIHEHQSAVSLEHSGLVNRMPGRVWQNMKSAHAEQCTP